MRFLFFAIPLFLAISALNSASAATFRIGVSTSLEGFGLTEYYLNGNYVGDYSSTDPDDPVIENFKSFGFSKSVSSKRGVIRFAADTYDWRSIGPCTGVFETFTCNFPTYFGQLTGSSINLSDYYEYDEYLVNINSEIGEVFATYEPVDAKWSNSLGNHRLGGAGYWYLTHTIDGISISQVPVPASGLLMLLSLAGFGVTQRLRRR